MNRERKLLAPAVLVGAAFVILMSLELEWLRSTVAIGFCSIAPGLGWARCLNFKNIGDTWAMTAVLSISMTVVVATAMAVTGLWSPLLGIGTLCVFSVLGILVAHHRGVRKANSEQPLAQVRMEIQRVTRWKADMIGPVASDLAKPWNK